MNRYCFLISSLFLFAQSLSAQVINTTLDSFANIYISAVEDNDIETMLTLTHPDVIAVSGGETYAKQDLLRDADDYNRLKLRLTSIKTKISSKIIESGEELHALVPYQKIYDSEGLRHEEDNFYLAASLDQGESWTFLDLRKHTVESIPVFVPAYNGRLNIFLKNP